VPSLCKQGVRGSSPLGSTHFPLSDRVCPCLVAVLLVRTAESTAMQTPAIYLFGPTAEQPRNFITSQIAQRKLKYAGHPLVLILPALACTNILLIISSKRGFSGESLMRTGTLSSRAFHHHGGRRRGGPRRAGYEEEPGAGDLVPRRRP
jgi:hypothetical protein